MAKVEFPRHLNRPRVLVAIEIDTVVVSVLSFSGVYLAVTFSTMPVYLTLFAAIGVSFAATKTYLGFKEEAPKGFIWHLLYELGIWKTREEVSIFPELHHIKDMDEVLPDGFIEELRD